LALEIRFFMSAEDERELMRRLEPMGLELWPVFSRAGFSAPLASAGTELVEPAYYLAAGDVSGYPIRKGRERGKWKIDEVASPVIYFLRSLPDDKGELRSGYFWAETEASGDNARTGGKPVRFLRAVREVQEMIKSRYRKSAPVRGLTYFIGPACARAGTPLREDGRKGEPVRAYR
jgi:hypothetical protein